MIDVSPQFKGVFLDKLKERAARWAAVKDIKFRLRVPPQLAWWYYQEFGTATKFDKPPASVGQFHVARPVGNRSGGHKYVIEAVNADMLRFEYYGTIWYKKRVMHRGVKPSRNVLTAIPDIQRRVDDGMKDAFRSGAADNPEVLKTAIRAAMKDAKDMIVTNMERNLSQTEREIEGGKLGGRRAAEVFDESAEIVEG